MKVLKIISLLMIVIVTGCGSPYVATSNRAFFVDTYSSKGSISVVSAEAGVNSSLKFAVYKRKFESKLLGVGYQIEKILTRQTTLPSWPLESTTERHQQYLLQYLVKLVEVQLILREQFMAQVAVQTKVAQPMQCQPMA